MMFNPASDDKIVHCPYNKNHTMPSMSLQRHIVKCEKNYGANSKVICPFNATHRLSKSEIEEHIKSCPTRRVVEVGHVERITQEHITHASTAKQKDEYSFASTIEDSCEEQTGVFKSASKFAYMNQNDDSERDDLESLTSSMGCGRGRIIPRFDNAIKLQFLKRSYNS